MTDIKKRISEAFGKDIFFTPHALHQMNSPDRLILRKEIEEVIIKGDVIEDYPEDARGHSGLIMANVSTGRVVHVVCAPKQEYLTVISAYLPNPDKWQADMKTRKRE